MWDVGPFTEEKVLRVSLSGSKVVSPYFCTMTHEQCLSEPAQREEMTASVHSDMGSGPTVLSHMSEGESEDGNSNRFDKTLRQCFCCVPADNLSSAQAQYFYTLSPGTRLRRFYT